MWLHHRACAPSSQLTVHSSQFSPPLPRLLLNNHARTTTYQCRMTMTFLRGTVVNNIIPMDETISFHKTIGKMLFACMLFHVAGWLIIALKYSLGTKDDFTDPYYLTDGTMKKPRLWGDFNPAVKFEAWRFLLWYQKGWFGLISGFAGPTGTIITILFSVLFFFAYGPIRRKMYMAFFFTHLLYIPMQILLIFHCERYVHSYTTFLRSCFTYEYISYRISYLARLAKNN